MAVFLALSAFIVYATWAAFQNAHYTFGPYLSPFYSPELFGDSPHAGSGRKPAWWPAWLPFSPALLILPFPAALPLHLLLLPRRLLQGVLGRPAVVRGRRAAQGLLRRALVPADPAEHPPLLPVHRGALPRSCSPTTSGRRCGSPIRRPAASEFGIGVGTLVLARERRPARRLHARLPLAPPRRRRPHRRDLDARRCASACYNCVELPQPRHMLLAWMSLFSVAFSDVYVRLLLDGHLDRLEDSSDARRIRRLTTTTCSSSAPAAPGCARRSRRRAAGVSVGLICKSLLGKAHTVMAEGGMAAAHGQRRRPRQLEGALRRHDARRPVRQQLAHGRAARQGSAGPRARARGLGRGVRPHARRPHPPAQLRRPPLSAARARRRPHRPRADPHAAGSRASTGHRPCTWSTRSSSCSSTAAASPARSAYDRERGRFHVFAAKAVVLATGGIGRAYKITSNSWEGTGDGHALAYRRRRRADRHGVHPVPSDRDGLAAERARHSRHRRRARRRRRAEEQRRPPLHVRRHPGQLQAADGDRCGRRLALHAGRQERRGVRPNC